MIVKASTEWQTRSAVAEVSLGRVVAEGRLSEDGRAAFRVPQEQSA
jgi:hypothetical protein